MGVFGDVGLNNGASHDEEHGKCHGDRDRDYMGSYGVMWGLIGLRFRCRVQGVGRVGGARAWACQEFRLSAGLPPPFSAQGSADTP